MNGRLIQAGQCDFVPPGLLSPEDFDRTLSCAQADDQLLLPRTGDPVRLGLDDHPQQPFVYDQVRERIERLTSRAERDRMFRRMVLKAYDQRCAVTGLRLINGGGRAEVDAAHIRPVEHDGPDSLNNGIALSGTAHWMFDRGLITLDDDLTIRVSRQTNDPDSIRSLVNRSGFALAPARASDRPHRTFLRWHREHCFKP